MRNMTLLNGICVKRLVIALFSVLLVSMPAWGFAGPKEDYEEAYKFYIAAGASAERPVSLG
jgi:hypothetical protein